MTNKDILLTDLFENPNIIEISNKVIDAETFPEYLKALGIVEDLYLFDESEKESSITVNKDSKIFQDLLKDQQEQKKKKKSDIGLLKRSEISEIESSLSNDLKTLATDLNKSWVEYKSAKNLLSKVEEMKKRPLPIKIAREAVMTPLMGAARLVLGSIGLALRVTGNMGVFTGVTASFLSVGAIDLIPGLSRYSQWDEKRYSPTRGRINRVTGSSLAVSNFGKKLMDRARYTLHGIPKQEEMAKSKTYIARVYAGIKVKELQAKVKSR